MEKPVKPKALKPKNAPKLSDADIIAAHPELRDKPYELMMQHGLSQKGYDDLIREMDSSDQKQLKAGKPRPVNERHSPFAPVGTPSEDDLKKQVLLKARTGGVGEMVSYKIALERVRRNPKTYYIQH